MILSTPILSVIKYSFLGLIVTGAGFLIANTALTMHYKSDKMEHLAYKAQPFPRNVSLSLHRNSLLCLTHPSQPFCLMSSKKRLELLKNRHLSSDTASKGASSSHSAVGEFYLFMKEFVDFANDLKVAPILLEPSILFCMLSTLQKYQVISNNLQTKVLQGSPNTIRFGISERESKTLTQESSVKKILELGYEFIRTREQFFENEELVDTSFSFRRENLTVTVLVFFQRETFMWHPGSLEKEAHPFHPLQFTSNEAYENFTAVPFILENGVRSGFHLPSELIHFLLHVQNSKFEECRRSLSSSEDIITTHPTLNHEQLTQRALIAIQELKSVFRPQLGLFWLWNNTLSGWEERCDIFEKTSELQIAVALPSTAADPRMDLNNTFTNNQYLHPVDQWDKFLLHFILDCYGLRIHITVIYADHDSTWNYERNTTGDLTKKKHPHLQLCSASVLGQLVLKPCSRQTSY